jgi:hypothetical protein
MTHDDAKTYPICIQFSRYCGPSLFPSVLIYNSNSQVFSKSFFPFHLMVQMCIITIPPRCASDQDLIHHLSNGCVMYLLYAASSLTMSSYSYRQRYVTMSSWPEHTSHDSAYQIQMDEPYECDDVLHDQWAKTCRCRFRRYKNDRKVPVAYRPL